jgi:hypothetical protein
MAGFGVWHDDKGGFSNWTNLIRLVSKTSKYNILKNLDLISQRLSYYLLTFDITLQKTNYSAQLPRHTISPLLVGFNFLPLHYHKLEGQSCRFLFISCLG